MNYIVSFDIYIYIDTYIRTYAILYFRADHLCPAHNTIASLQELCALRRDLQETHIHPEFW